MTISKGVDWGRHLALPEGTPVLASDSAAADVIARGASLQVGLIGGDLCKTLGGNADPARLRAEGATEVPIDVGVLRVDGGAPRMFVAHVVARRRAWQGSFVVVANVQWLGRWKVAPRAHPNDGQLDILEGALSVTDRVKARRRATSGGHLPHPGLRMRRTSAAEFIFERGLHVWVDGKHIGRGRHLEVSIRPDFALCVVG